MSLRTRIVLSTLCAFNAITTTVAGIIALLYVDRPAGPVLAAMMWLSAGGLVGLGRWLRRGTEWG